jgi:protein gp37
MAHRLAGMEATKARYAGLTTARAHWNGELRLFDDEIVKGYDRFNKMKRPRKIFIGSMGDIFHDKMPTSFIDKILEVVSALSQHQFMILTKRAHNIENKLYGITPENGCRSLGGGDYYPNLWLGITAENQEALIERLPYLMKVPAAKRFISVEPMLSAVSLPVNCGVDLVICGPETGAKRRPCKRMWIEDLRDNCSGRGIKFLMKAAAYKILSPLKN